MNKIRNNYFCPWIYPSNWIDNIKEIFYSIKRRYLRGKYGICNYDVWDLGDYLLEVFDNGLEKYLKDNQGHPGFLAEEEYNNVIRRMLELIAVLKIEGIDCPEADYYFEIYLNTKNDDKYSKINEEANKLFLDKSREWSIYRQECLEELCDIMKIYFFDLWW